MRKNASFSNEAKWTKMSLIHHLEDDRIVIERDRTYHPTAKDIDKQIVLSLPDLNGQPWGTKYSKSDRDAISKYPSTGEERGTDILFDSSKYPIIRIDNQQRNYMVDYCDPSWAENIPDDGLDTSKTRMYRRIIRCKTKRKSYCIRKKTIRLWGCVIEGIVFRGDESKWPDEVTFTFNGMIEYQRCKQFGEIGEYTYVGIPSLSLSAFTSLSLEFGFSATEENEEIDRNQTIEFDVIICDLHQHNENRGWINFIDPENEISIIDDRLEIPKISRTNPHVSKDKPDILIIRMGIMALPIDDEALQKCLGNHYDRIMGRGRAVKRAR